MKKWITATIIGISILSLSLAGCGKQSATVTSPGQNPKPVVETPTTFGKLSIYDRDDYEGQIRDGKANGQGALTFGINKKYVGEFKDNKFNGKGTLTENDGNVVYVGEFKDGEKNGQGSKNSYGIIYVGEFKDNYANGLGTKTDLDGNKYVGEFEDGEENGQGTLTSQNGTITSGIWINGKYSGK